MNSIVVTGSEDKREETIKLFSFLNAETIFFPAIKIIPIVETAPLLEALLIDRIDFIVFPSANSVKVFKELSLTQNFERFITNCHITAIGNKTAEACKQNGIKVDLIPNQFNAASAAEELIKIGVKGKRVLVLQSVIGREELKIKLRTAGANVFVVAIYNNILPEKNEVEKEIKLIEEKNPTWWVFTSPSAFNNSIKLLNIKDEKEYFQTKKIAVIGTTTAEEINSRNLKVDIIPEEFSLQGIVNSLTKYFNT